MSGPIKYAQPMANADVIAQLPSDQSQPTYTELRAVDALFKDHGTTMGSIALESRETLFIGLLFIIFNLPVVDSLVIRFIPTAETSPYMLIGIKTLILMLTYWVLKHFYLSRKN